MKPLLLAYAGDPNPTGYAGIVYAVMHAGKVRFLPGYRYRDDPNLEVVDTTTLVPTFAGAAELARGMVPC